MEENKNTYDNIVLSYAERASAATDSLHTINYYNTIINDYTYDSVPQETKARLIAENEEIFAEIRELSTQYCEIANLAIDELFYTEVNSDLQYLILPEVTTDIPVKLVAAFVTVLAFGLLMIAALLRELAKNISKKTREEEKPIQEKVEIDVSGMSRTHQLVYEQYLKDFEEFYLVYQPMVSDNDGGRDHLETLIRWRSEELGMVSPCEDNRLRIRVRDISPAKRMDNQKRVRGHRPYRQGKGQGSGRTCQLPIASASGFRAERHNHKVCV